MYPGSHIPTSAPTPNGGFGAAEQTAGGEMGPAHPQILLQLLVLLDLHVHLHHCCLPPACPGEGKAGAGHILGRIPRNSPQITTCTLQMLT